METRKSSLKQEIMELQQQLQSQIMLRHALEKELIREISVLENQVVSLETHLLYLIHKQSEAESPASGIVPIQKDDDRSFRFAAAAPRMYNVVERCYSSLSHHSATSAAVSRAIGSCHYSLPLSMLEDGAFGDDSSPNWVSEEMVKCISTIYIELSKPSSSNLGGLSEVRWMNLDSMNLQDMQHKMHHFRCSSYVCRSLVSRLESAKLEKMRHGEKLAFWINVYNSLVMHAFLVYGIPRNHVRRMSLALKASCNVGGHTVSVEMIQSSILGCHVPRPRQWLGALLHPWRKPKINVADLRKPYTVNTCEPRLYFALCTGSYSDPPLRVYAAETVFSDLEAAKQDYIQTSLTLLNKKNKKKSSSMVELFAKDSNLGDQSALMETELLDLVDDLQLLPARAMIIRWVPHSFEFRYLITRDS
ncbi:hypothetical protein LINPERPRIM_LOCUS9011 [Linum perenne]